MHFDHTALYDRVWKPHVLSILVELYMNGGGVDDIRLLASYLPRITFRSRGNT